MDVKDFGARVERWGWRRVVLAALYQRMLRLTGLHLFVINSRPLDVAMPMPELPANHQVRRLQPVDDDPAVANPALGLNAEFLQQARARGDICIGYFDQGELVSYFWCGFNRVPADPGIAVKVPPRYSYAYKAMTLASHRGRHLQQILTAANDKLLCQEGYTHNIEYIDVANFPQRRASARYGNRTIGLAAYIERDQGHWIVHSPGVKKVGFAFEQDL